MLRHVAVLCFFVVIPAALFSQTTDTTKPNDQEGAVIEQLITRVHFENDGTGTRETTTNVRVQSEAGVQAYGQIVVGYSSETEKLDVDYVRVRKPDGRIVPTPAGNEQDFAPEVFRSAPMYSDFRERHVTVVGLRPGDVLEYRTTIHVKTPLAQNHFWYEYSFPVYQAVNEARLEVEIPKSREVKLKSPKHKYETSEQGEWRTYKWVEHDIKAKRFDLDSDEDEDDSDDEFADIQLSSFSDWKQVASWYAKLQEERVSQDDAIRKKAAELTAGATTPTEKARRIYDYVAKDFRYVSLSFGVGRLQPHAASEVMAAGYGDCKDKGTLLEALLRAAGIKSYPVLIGAGRKLDLDMPSPAQFNHLITAARIGTDLVWLDSTQEVAPFGHLLYELRNENALIASEDQYAGVRKTPADSPVKSSITIVLDGIVQESGAMDGTVEITASGDSSIILRMSQRRLTPADWQRVAKSMSIAGNGDSEAKDITFSDTENADKPIRMKFRIHNDRFFVVPSASSNFMPFPPLPPRRLAKAKKNEPIGIGPAGLTVYRVHLQFPPNFTLQTPTQIALARDYADFSTTFKVVNNVLDAEEKFNVKMNEIPEARRNDYSSFNGVATNIPFRTMSLNIRPASREALAVKLPASTESPAQLHKTGVKALDQRDYQTAVTVLKQLTEQAPATTDAWDELGRAYAGLDDYPNAVAAFKHQIEVDKYHKRAYNDLAFQFELKGQSDDAVGAYRQQLENIPLDRTARKNLGLLLLKLKRDKDAISELENFASVPPPDMEVNLALAQLYTRTNQSQKAKDLLLPIVGTSGPFPGGDLYAAALRDDIDVPNTLRDSRKTLDDIGDEFDSPSYSEESIGPAMQFVALAWARTGWAKAKQDQTLEAIRYLSSSWMLSQSGVVAYRLGVVYDKANQKANAKRYYALAAAAGGTSADAARAELQKLDSTNAEKLITQSQAELSRLSTIKFANPAKKTGTAEYGFTFDGTDKPDRVKFQGGAPELRALEEKLVDSSYPVMFPEVSSVKLVRKATVVCTATECTVSLKPVVVDANLVAGL